MDNEGNHSDGYCLTCAHSLGVKPVDDMIKQFGISDADLENMEEKFAGFMGENGMNLENLSMEALSVDAASAAESEEAPDDDDFTPGGSAVFPFAPLENDLLGRYGPNDFQFKRRAVFHIGYSDGFPGFPSL